MEELKTTKDRLLHFLGKKDVTRNACERMLGASSGFLYKETTEFSTDTIRKLSDIFPELNIMWLIFGTGSMENGGTEELASDDHKKYVAQLEARVQELSEHVEDLREMLRMKKDYQAKQPMAVVG